MKGSSREELEKGRPQQVDALGAIQFCLNALYKDRTKEITELVVYECSYEELIGALLLARDSVEELLEVRDSE